ncbi:MAG: folate-binding protein YgfZ [Rhodocyclaceae bacterium]|nr:folate-binding protein YgfZ [Rhodocyclaceae bacterium]
MNQEWNDFLLQQGFAADFEHRGHLLDETRAATIAVPLVDSALIRASGEDNAAFLHNLLTNDVTGIPADGVRYAGFCTPKGRLLATFLIWHDGADLWLQTAADIQPTMQKKLSMYILRSKAKLHDGAEGENARVLIGLAGPQAAGALAALKLGTPPGVNQVAAIAGGQVLGVAHDRYVLALDVPAAKTAWPTLKEYAIPAGLNAWRLRDIADGLPRVVAATQEQFIPQMVNFEAVGGVSFKKGCYPGQEIVARTQYLGKIKRRMYRATVAAPAVAGQDLYAPETGEQSCGNVVIAAQTADNAWECLVVLQSSAYDAVNLGSGAVHLGATDGPILSFLNLPYEN